MRTAEQGQAAAPQEREHRRRYLRLPGRSSWAVGEYLSDCHKLWSAIQRSSPCGLPCGEGIRLCHGRVCAHGFLFARNWAVRAQAVKWRETK